jgi:chromate transporter
LSDPEPTTPSAPVSWREMWTTWGRVALLSFGGPAGQIAVMHRIIVDEKKWLSEERFLHALNFCMLLPGPEAQQLATYTGWLLHRTRGGLLAGGLFILPGLLSILVLSIIYAEYGTVPIVQAVFFGLKPAVMAIVIEAVIRIGKRVLKNGVMLTVAVMAFIAIFFLEVPFPLVILIAGVVGFLGGRWFPERFSILKGHAAKHDTAATPVIERVYHDVPPTWTRALRVSAICLPLWFAPIVIARQMLGADSVFYQEGVFFSQAAMVTFGGAYSVLAYVAQQAVENFGWLQSGEMLDGLGMAETTPGPLIMVVQFVGFMGAYRHPGSFDPLTAGIIGSLLTTWVTFVPCFYWIFLGAPLVERLRSQRTLNASLSTITAAVVGVVLNLAIWFAIHTLFTEVWEFHLGPVRLFQPVWSTFDLRVAILAALAMILTFVWKRDMITTLALCVIAGVALFFWR